MNYFVRSKFARKVQMNYICKRKRQTSAAKVRNKIIRCNMKRKELSKLVNDAAIVAVENDERYALIDMGESSIEVIDIDGEPIVLVNSKNRIECVILEKYLTDMLPDLASIAYEREQRIRESEADMTATYESLERQFV